MTAAVNVASLGTAMSANSSGNVGIGTSSPQVQNWRAGTYLTVANASTRGQIEIDAAIADSGSASLGALLFSYSTNTTNHKDVALIEAGSEGATANQRGGCLNFYTKANGTASPARNMVLDSSGNLLVGKTAAVFADAGGFLSPTGKGVFTVNADEVLLLNRLTNDGNLIRFYQASTEEGNISVSGTTVSYNGGHLSRWAQMLTKPELFKGTVLSNLDEMNVYTTDGQPVDNEQLNKVKVSDVEGDANVAGVFVNWSYDDDHDIDEINMAMTGDMIIRIAQGTTVARGDLLMSAGDGTAKPQGDDIVRSKTVAKVTSTHVTCTYADGSFCVPCVLMAC